MQTDRVKVTKAGCAPEQYVTRRDTTARGDCERLDSRRRGFQSI
jgi:hypothetical protein